MADNDSVLLTILNKGYRVNCPPEQRAALLESARYLDERMGQIQRRGGNLVREQVAVMVALNLVHERLSKPSGNGEAIDSRHLVTLEEKLDRALVDIGAG